MKIAFTTALLILLFFKSLFGQIYFNSLELNEDIASDTLNFTITKIEVAGNVKTKDFIITRELYFKEKDTVSLKQLFLSQKRVINLFLFDRVIFDLIGESNDITLAITVSERWYFFPLPLVYRNERSWSKLSYGAKLLYYNFLGRNILLNFTSAFGYNPEFKLAYRDMWFGGDLKLLTNFMIYKSHIRWKNLEYRHIEDERVGVEWLIGKRFGNFFYLMLNLSFVELRQLDSSVPEFDKNQLPGIGLAVQYDNRDLKEYPHQGFNFTLSGKQIKKAPLDYRRYSADLRCYIPVTQNTTLALRGAANLSDGKIPLYDRVFLGYEERIRGKFYNKFEGENLFISGIEYRFPLVKIRYFDLSEISPPGFESYYSNMKFGVSAGIFYDTGTVWDQNEHLEVDDLHRGFGFGLHFHIPYADILRTEIAFDKDWNIDLIAEVAVAF